MDLSIITVTWNSAANISEQLRSVRAAARQISFEQIVVDNASDDDTISLLKAAPDIRLIANQKNLGFSAANNQGARLAKGDFWLFLNPDMRVMEGSLDQLVAWMRANPEIGVGGVKLVTESGATNQAVLPRRFPSILDAILLLLKIPHISPGVHDCYLMRDVDFGREQSVDSVRGSFLCLRRSVYEKLGRAVDPRYFIWFEDVDLCREVKRLGYDVRFTPDITCVDRFGQSFRAQNFFWKQWQFVRSMIRYFLKWAN